MGFARVRSVLGGLPSRRISTGIDVRGFAGSFVRGSYRTLSELASTVECLVGGTDKRVGGESLAIAPGTALGSVVGDGFIRGPSAGGANPLGPCSDGRFRAP